MILPGGQHERGGDERPISGMLLIDKPLGYTSMGVCATIRGKLKAGGAPKRIKVGHGGTLDPLATGLLVVLVGRATKLSDRIMADAKEYTTTIDLGVRNETHDLEAETVPVEVPCPPTRGDVDGVLSRFIGTIEQVPPAHSAMKVGGKRAYALARAGEVPPLVARPVRIDAIEVIGYAWPRLELRISCGKGTYIRSLARDIGAALGTGGVLTALRRTRSGAFSVEDATTLDGLANPLDPADLPPPPEFSEPA